MSDTKLRPEDLTSEERAIVEEMVTRTATNWGWIGCAQPYGNGVTEQFAGWTQQEEWAEAYKSAFARILARRALFAPAPEKVECPGGCGEMLPHKYAHAVSGDADTGSNYTCQPAPPEPAASYLSDSVIDNEARRHCDNASELRVRDFSSGAAYCRSWYEPELRSAIAAAKETEQGRKVELGKVRELIEWEVKNNGSGLWAAALAELDAAEKG